MAGEIDIPASFAAPGDVTGKRVVVTGASRGLGRIVASALSQSGARVALVARTEADLKALADDLPGPSLVLPGEVTDDEFNALVDPEAAEIVFSSGKPLMMVGLNLTHQAQASPEVVDRLRAVGNPAAEATVGWLSFFADTYRTVYGFAGPPVHDVARRDRVGGDAGRRLERAGARPGGAG